MFGLPINTPFTFTLVTEKTAEMKTIIGLPVEFVYVVPGVRLAVTSLHDWLTPTGLIRVSSFASVTFASTIFAVVIVPLSIVQTVPELETVMSPLSPSATDAVGVPQDVDVPFVVRNLPLLPV